MNKPNHCYRCKEKLLNSNRIDCYNEFDTPVAYHTYCYEIELDEPTPSLPPPIPAQNKHINPANIRQVKLLRTKGYSQREIAQELGLSDHNVYTLLHWQETEYRKKMIRRSRKIGRLRYAGFTTKEIAKIMGMKIFSVIWTINHHHYEAFIDPSKSPKLFMAWVRKMDKLNVPQETIAAILDVEVKEVIQRL